MSKILDRLARVPNGKRRAKSSIDQMELFTMSTPAKEDVTNDTPAEGTGDAASAKLHKELETLKTRLAAYEKGGSNHELVVKGAEEAMRRQRELEAQVDNLRRDMAEILAARATEQKLLEAAEAHCAELETRLEEGGNDMTKTGGQEKEYKQALAQATNELDDLRSQFSHYEAQFKNGSQEQDEKIRILETKLRKTGKEADELRQAIEEEKRQRAVDAHRFAEQEKILAQSAASNPAGSDELDQRRVALEEREEALRMNIERFNAEQTTLNKELDDARAALTTEKERASKTKSELARQASRYEKEIAELKQALDSARATPPPVDTEQERVTELQDQLDALRDQLVAIDGERSKAVNAIEDERRLATSTIAQLQEEFKAREAQHAKQLAEQQAKAQKAALENKQVDARTAEVQKVLAAEREARATDQAESRDRERQLLDQLKNAKNLQRQLEYEVDKEQARTLTMPRIIGLVVLVVILCGGFFALGSWISKATTANVTIPETPPLAAPAIAAPASRIATATSRPGPATPSWPVLQVNNFRTRTSGSTMTVIFDYGLFVRRAELSLKARQDLSKLAAQLKPSLGNIKIEVEGHSDSDPAGSGLSSGNHILGQKRAQAVCDYFARNCGIPAASMTATSAGEANPPFPNDTPESRKKNRTVVLKLIPAG